MAAFFFSVKKGVKRISFFNAMKSRWEKVWADIQSTGIRKSLMFALEEVKVVRKNKTIQPAMLVDISWSDIEKSMFNAVKEYIATKQSLRRKKG